MFVALTACGPHAEQPFSSVAPAQLAPFVARQPTAPRGLALLGERGPFAKAELAIAHAIVASNPRLARTEALGLAIFAARVARAERLSPEFFCATLLQESAFDGGALSSAGAMGIAQFTAETADGLGIDPFDVYASIGASAQLLASYYRRYARRFADPYAVTLAAYNAGPQAVAHHAGVPPYPETRDYIAAVYDRWARIELDER